MRFSIIFFIGSFLISCCDCVSQGWRGIAQNLGDPTVVLGAPSVSADFYVSISGTGSGNGSVGNPYTMAQAISKMENLAVGEDTIAFKNGDRFELLDSAILVAINRPLVLRSYGAGPLAHITGGVDEHGISWTQEATDLWYCSVPSEVFNVHLDGDQAVYASYPADPHSFVTVSTITDRNTFKLTNYNKASNPDVNGSICFGREELWESEQRTVTNVPAGDDPSIDVSTNFGGDLSFGMRVKFFGNKVFLVSGAEGMWWYDSNNSRLYLRSLNNPNIDYSSIVFTYNEHFFLNVDGGSNVTLQELKVTHFKTASVFVTNGATGVRIQNNIIEDNLMFGIYNDGDNGTLIQGNIIKNCNSFGIYGDDDYDDIEILSNTIDSIGIWPYYGHFDWVGDIAQHAIYLNSGSGDRGLILNNTISNAGASAIHWKGQTAYIAGNIIDNVLLNIADMGAIYTYGGTTGLTNENVSVARNRITNVKGLDLKTQNLLGNTYGLYFDGLTENSRMDSNYVAVTNQGQGGIFVQAGNQNINIRYDTVVVEDNTNILSFCIMWRNRTSQSQQTINITMTNCHFTMNGTDNTNAMIIRYDDNVDPWPGDIWDPSGTIDNNQYFLNDVPADLWFMIPNNLSRTFAQWQAASGEDLNSTITYTP